MVTEKAKALYSNEFFDEIQDGSARSARVVLPIVFDLLRPRSVLDVGCGRGAWLRVAGELGADLIQGLDGSYVSPASLLIPRARFEPTDLSRKFTVPGRYDLTLCMEVAEHLPKSSSASLIDSLTASSDAVLFSAAIPGQQGSRHINEQFPEFWFSLFSKHGYLPLDIVRPRIAWDDRVEPWYAQNVLLYVNKDYYASHPSLRPFAPITDPAQLLRWVHAGIWRGRVRWTGPLGILKLMARRLVFSRR